ncbi:YjiH family protein [Virgibacillus salexigens]|uniref:YjiH family protein n=1 Tax=Virgibacillus TaxID=84406 RepID=UPI001E5A3992|nr:MULTISPECIES: YjiH family protein [Virgibacillus]
MNVVQKEIEKSNDLEKEDLSFWTPSNQWKSFIVSLTGLFLFLVPIPYQGQWTIGIGIIAEFLQNKFEVYLPTFMTGVLILSVLGTTVMKVGLRYQKQWATNSKFLRELLDVNWFWGIFRILGAVFAVMTLYELGPKFIWTGATGGTVLFDLIPVLTTWFLIAGFLMPLLLNFGLMEFIGTVVRGVMRPLFKLPGRSSIDALASWMGSGTVGVLITTQQYESGFYTKREASVIATNFSIASIAFSLLVINFIGMGHMFVQFYITVIVAGVIAAIIIPRIPPLSRKEDNYYELAGKQIAEEVPTGKTQFRFAMEKAVARAAEVKSISSIVKSGVQNVIDIWFGLLPLVMGLGTIALIIAEFTPVFHILAYPFVPLLEWANIPEASEAAPAMIVGFADMFLPAVIGSGIESELTRFVIASLSMTQLIYISEVGILILRSKIPISFLDMVIIFLQRTIITLPIIILMAQLFFL